MHVPSLHALPGFLRSSSSEKCAPISEDATLSKELLDVLQGQESEVQAHFHNWVSELRRMQREHAQQCAELTNRVRCCSSSPRPPDPGQATAAAPPPVPPPSMSVAPAWEEPREPRPPAERPSSFVASVASAAQAAPAAHSTVAASSSAAPPTIRTSSEPRQAANDGPSLLKSQRRFAEPISLLYGEERQGQRSRGKRLDNSMTTLGGPSSRRRVVKWEGWLRTFMRSGQVRAVCSVMILANAIFMGFHAEQSLQALIHGRDGVAAAWDHIELAFCVFFTIELLLRAAAERRKFLASEECAWNLFDTFLVLLSLLDYAISSFTDATSLNLTFARTLRIFRFARILRIVRVMRFFYSFRLMVYSVLYSIVSLLWVFFMLVFVMYFFAIFFLHGVAEYFKDSDGSDVELRAQLERAFGTLSSALLSLFMSISGGIDWIEVKSPLAGIHWAYGVIFLFYIFFMIFGVLNVVMASFVESATQISRRDRELVTQNEMDKLAQYAQNVRRFFHEADIDQTGTLCWEEFEEYLLNEKVQAYFHSFELDVTQARTLFQLLDLDESNDVGIDEFVEGCKRMKGSARSIDVNMLLFETEKMIDKQMKFMAYVEDQFAQLWASQGLPQPSTPAKHKRPPRFVTGENSNTLSVPRRLPSSPISQTSSMSVARRARLLTAGGGGGD